MKDDNNSRKKLLKKIVDLTDKKKFIEAKELLNTIKDKNILSDSIYYELSAKIHFDMNDFNKALFFLKRLEEIDNGLNYENKLKLVSVYFINGNNEKGWIIFNNLLNQKGASDFEYTKIILQLLEIFINIPKYDLAETFFLLLENKSLNEELKRKYYFLKYKLLKIKRNYKSALSYKKRAFELKQKIINENAENNLKIMRSKYDIKRRLKEKELYILENIELKKINLSKNKFFSIVAHDLRSPFSSILSFISLIKKHHSKMTKTEMKNLIEELEKIVKNSYSLLENLLEWARFQTGALKYNPEFFYIKDSIEYVIKILQPIAQQKNIKIESKLRKKFIVYADKFMINTILRNLINNAIKFTYSNGHITISQKKMKNFLKISVKDNGIGMDKIILDKLFKLEESFSTKGTNKEKGTGLGLILCKEFIEINKGKIGVKTKKNIGTEFYFTIPMDVNHDK